MPGARARLLVGTLAGVAILAALGAHLGTSTLRAALDALSWPALGIVCLFQAGSIALCGVAWWVLTERSGLVAVTGARWIREGASSLFGIAPGIGEVAGGRALILYGGRPGDVAASTAVDVVTDTLALAVFAIWGLVPLLGQAAGGPVLAAAAAISGAVLPLAAIYLLWRSARAVHLLADLLTRLGRRFGVATPAGWHLAARVETLYERRRPVAASTLIHLAAWVLGGIQVWAAAAFLGMPLSFLGAMSLHSLGSAARGAAFLVPMGAGVQEVSFVLVGAAVGLGEAEAIAMSLLLRARDVAVAIPALLLWLVAEAREVWRAARTTA